MSQARSGRRASCSSGRPAGERRKSGGPFPDGSFNAAVERVLAENLERLKALRTNSDVAATPRSASG